MNLFDPSSISTLINGPDNRYKQILLNESSSPSEQCKDNNSFLQISVRMSNEKHARTVIE